MQSLCIVTYSVSQTNYKCHFCFAISLSLFLSLSHSFFSHSISFHTDSLNESIMWMCAQRNILIPTSTNHEIELSDQSFGSDWITLLFTSFNTGHAIAFGFERAAECERESCVSYHIGEMTHTQHIICDIICLSPNLCSEHTQSNKFSI